jgi:N-acetyl-gamma-glutamyl-phosphate reductase common form
MSATPVFVAGARGLLAGEFLRLLAQHPGLTLGGASSRGGEGTLADAHPQLAGAAALRPPERLLAHAELAPRLADALARGPAALLLAMNHGETAPLWEELRAAVGAGAERLTVVDLSADHRLPPAGDGWSYGLPELHPVAPGARRIAAAGCFATAMQLAIVPAARAGLLAPAQPLIVHGVTGSSGSGAQAKPATHHPHRHDNLWVYAWEGHRHEAEVTAARNFPAGAPPLHFTACSGPFSRGIHLSAVLPLARALTSTAARECYAEAFRDAACVRVLDAGTPQLRAVTSSNRADLAAGVRGEMLHVYVALDNVVKGGAGQGLQCLNLALDLPETAGLPLAGLGC